MKGNRMKKLVVYNTSVLKPDMTIERNQTVEVENGVFTAIRPYRAGEEEQVPKAGDDESLEGIGKLLMPGLCDSHMHTGQQLLKGRILDELPMIWTRIMLPFESTLDEKKMELSAKLAALEMIRSGTTAFVDAGSYYMEAAADVYVKSGLRGLLSASTMDDASLPDSIKQTADEAVAQTDRLYEAYNGKENLKVAYSLRSLISCSEELIQKAGTHARERDAILQAHMNEYPNEVNYFLQKKQMRLLEYLESLQVLDENFLAAHSILLSENEKEILKKYHVNVCHCPFSNCGKGIPDTPALLQKDVNVGLGTDGAAHGGLSLWNEMKIFRSVMNVGRGVPIGEAAIMPAKTIIRMATENGYKAMHVKGGRIEPGQAADFITIDLRQPHLYPTGNLVNTLLECVTAADVCDTVTAGKILMKNRVVLTLDEEKILSEAEAYMEKLEG